MKSVYCWWWPKGREDDQPGQNDLVAGDVYPHILASRNEAPFLFRLDTFSVMFYTCYNRSGLFVFERSEYGTLINDPVTLKNFNYGIRSADLGPYIFIKGLK